MQVHILVATHKQYPMPKDNMYIPVQVGTAAETFLDYHRDNTGDNIADKNTNYCELTALYWGWKNDQSEYLGLAHYRRHFKGSKKSKNRFEMVLSKSEIEEIFKEVDIILPKKRKYYIETIYNHYSNTFHSKDLDVTRAVIEKLTPEYLIGFDQVMQSKEAHLFNMMIMKKELLDAYCEWLFTILFAVEKELDITNYNAFEARVFGRVSERLLDVWLITHGHAYQEVPFLYMEKVNWYRKITGFLLAKFFKKKYKKSF